MAEPKARLSISVGLGGDLNIVTPLITARGASERAWICVTVTLEVTVTIRSKIYSQYAAG